jgi:hypothetical protein
MGPSLPSSQDRLSFLPLGVAMLPPTHSLGLTWLPGLDLPQCLLLICPFQADFPITHTSFPTIITWGLNYYSHMYTTLWAHDTLHMHTNELRFLSSFFLTFIRQASWPWPPMSGTLPTAGLPSLNPFRHSLDCLMHGLPLRNSFVVPCPVELVSLATSSSFIHPWSSWQPF